MQIVNGLHNLRREHGPTAVTIGKFDGVHLGHAAIIGQTKALARQHGVRAGLITFEPHPQEFFRPDSCPTRLSRFREKAILLRELDVDVLVCLRFDAELSKMSPALFVERLLVAGMGARALVVGEDFRYGHKGAGDFRTLLAAGEQFGFDVHPCESVKVAGRRVSSSGVREALFDGDIGKATAMLGRPYTMCGRVRRGRQLGRTIGFPTANVATGRVACPLRGVFAVRVHHLRDAAVTGMANIGTRPTVDGQEQLLEVHLFDFAEDIYGREIRVEFVSRLRDEERFDSLDALKAQIQRDQAAALEVLATNTGSNR